MSSYIARYEKRRLRSSYISVALSITVVLILVGLLCTLVFNASRLGDYFKEQLIVTAYLSPNTKEVEKAQLLKGFELNENTLAVTFISKEEAAKDYSEEIGQDFVEFLGFNPLRDGVEIALKAPFVSVSSIDQLATDLAQRPFVEEVIYDTELLGLLESNFSSIQKALAVGAVILLLFSILLINSSIKLSIYSKPQGNQPLLLFFKVGPDPRSWWGEMLVSYDRGRTFRDRVRLPETIDGPVRCKPIELSDGTLLAGSSTEYDGWRVHFEKTNLDRGLPANEWERIGPINSKEEFNAIQPTLLEHADGRLQALCRTQEGVISTTFSDDLGETWSKMTATNLPNPNSGIDAVSLQDGRHLLIYNHLGSGSTGWGRRGLLNLAVSEDGITWKKVGTLEREANAEFSYPAMIQTEDGLIHISYTWKRQRIKHVVVNPNAIEAGDLLSLDPWEEAE